MQGTARRDHQRIGPVAMFCGQTAVRDPQLRKHGCRERRAYDIFILITIPAWHHRGSQYRGFTSALLSQRLAKSRERG